MSALTLHREPARAVRLGDEHDAELFAIVREVLDAHGAVLAGEGQAVVGSQEISTWQFAAGDHRLTLVAETYEGLSIGGPDELVRQIVASVRSRS